MTLAKGDSYEVWGRVEGCNSKLGRDVHGCGGLCRHICKSWEDFIQHILFEIGAGNRVKF